MITVNDIKIIANKYGMCLVDLSSEIELGLPSSIYRPKDNLAVNPDVILAFSIIEHNKIICGWREYTSLKKDVGGYVWLGSDTGSYAKNNMKLLTVEYLERLIKKCKKKLIRKQQEIKLKEIEKDFV
jgi:hypothetical protein